MCVLHIEFETNDIDLILKSTNLPIYQVYRKGEKHKYKKNKLFDYNMISCAISDKDWHDFDGQVQDMISFIERYQCDLQLIKDNSSQLNWKFDFPYYNRLDETLFNQNDFLPPELLLHCGRLGIGINLSLYHSVNEE